MREAPSTMSSTPPSSGGRARGKKATAAAPSPTVAGGAADKTEVAAAAIAKFCATQEGRTVRQEVLEEKLRPSLSQDLLLAGLNRLMGQGRLLSFVRPNQRLSFKLQSAEEAAKLQGLSAEDRLVFQEVERASTAGISTKDLKTRANMQTPALTRVLKKLEGRKLVQHVKSVASKNKKMYLLVGLEPTREITGGSFYSGVEFDHELIRVLAQSALAYMQRKETATAAEVHAFIGESGLIRGKQLRLEDVDAVLQTLVYDARAEVTHDPRHGSENVYRVVQQLASVEAMVDSLMTLPPVGCESQGACDDEHQAAMSAWLELAVPSGAGAGVAQ